VDTSGHPSVFIAHYNGHELS